MEKDKLTVTRWKATGNGCVLGADGDKCDVSVRERLKLSLKIAENRDNASLVLTTTKQMNEVLEEKAAGLP